MVLKTPVPPCISISLLFLRLLLWDSYTHRQGKGSFWYLSRYCYLAFLFWFFVLFFSCQLFVDLLLSIPCIFQNFILRIQVSFALSIYSLSFLSLLDQSIFQTNIFYFVWKNYHHLCKFVRILYYFFCELIKKEAHLDIISNLDAQSLYFIVIQLKRRSMLWSEKFQK